MEEKKKKCDYCGEYTENFTKIEKIAFKGTELGLRTVILIAIKCEDCLDEAQSS